MEGYLDANDSTMYHLFNCFSSFLLALICFHTNDDKRFRNMCLDVIYVHARLLADFFSSASSKNDDITCSDILVDNSISLSLSEDTRKFLNKCVMHFTRKRTELSLDNAKFAKDLRELVKAIIKFMDCVDECINPDYRKDLDDKEVHEIRKIVEDLLAKISSLWEVSQ